MTKNGYHLITLGCQMNKSDSERIAGLLDSIGMREVGSPEEARLILFNSCSVRKSAEDRIFGRLRDFDKLKEAEPDRIFAVTGCLPGRDRDGKIRAKMPLVDLYFPIRDLPQLPRWIAEIDPEIVNSTDMEADYLKINPRFPGGKSAYVTIQTGCEKMCTYCVVPFARGREAYRPVKEILAEIRSGLEKGAEEFILLGQTVNNYQTADRSAFSRLNPYTNDFAALLWEVNALPGVRRIHYTAPHPVHMEDEVIDALSLPKQVNYLHLPVQAGNDEVLQRMSRRYTAEQYLEKVRKIRARNPGICLGTDIIVGFCGETAEQFGDTVRLYKEADFDISYTAIYSPRSGTAAFRAFEDDVPREEKKRRWFTLQDLMEQTVLRKNQAYLGQPVEVLVDSFDKGMCMGNSREMKRVQFPGKADDIGATLQVRVEKAHEWLLVGHSEGQVKKEMAYGQEKTFAT